MSKDFTLNNWREIWLKRLTPIVKRTDGTYETLIERYERFNRNILQNEQAQTYKEKLLGPDFIAGVPEDYSLMKAIEKTGYETWYQMSLEERGKWCALFDLDNMQELIREHMRLTKQEDAERQQRVNQANKS